MKALSGAGFRQLGRDAQVGGMSTIASESAGVGDDSRIAAASTKYGHFAPDGSEYVITNSRPPRPWCNIISNPNFGLAVSHTGSGFSWIGNSQLAVLTRWTQEFAHDSSGRFLYARDADSGAVWSLSPAPLWPKYEQFECRHGLGYTTFATHFGGVRAEWTLFAHETDAAECWRVELHNTSDRLRRIELTGFVEWNCGVLPSPRREFTKLFLDTELDPQRGAIFCRSHMWEAVHSPRWGHWNTPFPYVAAFASTEPVLSAQGDKSAFFGRFRGGEAPEALSQDLWKPLFGRHYDAVAALRNLIELRPGQKKVVGFVLAGGSSKVDVERVLEHVAGIGDGGDSEARLNATLEDAKRGWRERLASGRIETPEPTVNFLVNDWARYQAISGRIWGRAGYYQQSGAFGFRDQLQDSQVWLTTEPQRCREQIKLHAAHQFADGSVYHWWHPLTEQGHITKMTDDLLWLGFVAANYMRETGNLSILLDTAPFIDDAAPQPLVEHVWRAFQRVFQRTSPRGIPYLGGGDWNDGLNAVGLLEKGESFWLGHFLAGLLADWSEVFRRAAADPALGLLSAERAESRRRADEFSQRREKLVAAINEHGWDGQWYIRATLDDGRKLGSKANRVGRIFLNAQTWAVLSDVAPPDRAAQCMAAVREHLVSHAGALLLQPAFDEPMQEIGYITRYAPGLRENGGVYTHAATWAIAAACKMRDGELVGRLLTAINPALKDPDRYWAEPYVLPGNVDGPDSPLHGRAGWTWYTGSAAWLYQIVTQWVLGVRPTWDGLSVTPCLPPGWNSARLRRTFRGTAYDIRIERSDSLPAGSCTSLAVDGQPIAGNVLPTARDGRGVRQVSVLVR